MSGGGGVLVEFHLERHELVLGGTLSFLILLLLRQSALSGRSSRWVVGAHSDRRG